VKKSAIILIILVGLSGKQAIAQSETSTSMENDKKGRVIGIGGIFFKSKNPKDQRDWYSKNLGFKTDDYGSLFEFRDVENPEKKGQLQWSPFGENTTYFQPSEREFMINYRVVNMEALVEQLKATGVTICDSIEEFEYGKFIHIMDPEGNKIELWEPADEGFEETK
jgi:predicted enzyme related to lactoylglutathione lyase